MVCTIDRRYTEIISERTSLSSAINWDLLAMYTQEISADKVLPFFLAHQDSITHIHILGPDPADDHSIGTGCYVNPESTWMLLLYPTNLLRNYVLSSHLKNLELLDIRYTQIEEIDVSQFHRVVELDLSFNQQLRSLRGLEHVRSLEKLRLQNSPVQHRLVLENTALTRLQIEGTRIEQICTRWPLSKLQTVAAAEGALRDIDFIKDTPMLEYLDLEGCPLDEIPQLKDLRYLRYLDLSRTGIESLDDIIFPPELQVLSIARTNLQRIPQGVRELKKLLKLDLSFLRLQSLPQWLPELSLDFHTSSWNGIILTGTIVKGIDMSIFNEPQKIIRQWFQEREHICVDTPTNEIKVVFLGDGEAGKSLTIARLWDPELDPKSFCGDVTPGIDIKSKIYNLKGRQVRVNFWDFGGQEILHSMHRMFLSERTLYVILLNTRNDNQDERAHFWMRYVQTYAQDAPVLLVLNKLDQNPFASINETALRQEYPNITNIIGISAREYEREQFEHVFAEELERQINLFEVQEAPFLRSWLQVRDRMYSAPSHRMSRFTFQKLCDECGVGQGEERTALLRKLHETGVCVWFEGGGTLRQYMLLRPEWITNAIYMILFNKRSPTGNGIISHDEIYDLFDPDAQDIKKVSAETYNPSDIDYVLGVMRLFRMSFAMDGQDTEFIPMFCSRNESPVAAEYAKCADTLECRIRFQYLPADVLYQLMVERKNELDTDHVWLTGARFLQEDGTSAVIRKSGNMLTIYVRSDISKKRAKVYMDQLKGHIDLIGNSRKRKLWKEESLIVYKSGGLEECFDYDRLVLGHSCKISHVISKELRCAIPIQDVLDQTDRSIERERTQLLRDVLSACTDLQNDITYRNLDENARNRFLRNALHQKYIVHDQTQEGESATGIQPGEIDLEIRKDNDIPWIILEALNITGSGKKDLNNWNHHLEKMLFNYNPCGLRVLILVSYLKCGQKRYHDISDAYFTHMRDFAPEKIGSSPERCSYVHIEGTPENIHITQSNYYCGGYRVTVYHYLVLFRSDSDVQTAEDG